jgi:hypothetical protein
MEKKKYPVILDTVVNLTNPKVKERDSQMQFVENS